MKIADLYLAALISPRRLSEELAGRKIGGVLTPAFFAFAGGLVSAVMAFLILGGARGESGRALFSTLAIFVPIAALFILMLKLALVHLFASLWGLFGDIRLFWVSQALSFVPFFLLLPLTVLLCAIGLSGFFPLALIALWALAWRIELAAMSAVYKVNLSKAFALSILPLALAFVFVVLALLAFAALVGGLVFAALGLVF